MRHDDLIKELKQNRIRPVYYLCGDDDFMLQESYAALKEAVLRGGLQDFNVDVFCVGETDLSKVTSAAFTLPVMSPKRLVVLKDADKLKAAEEETFVAYLEDPSPSTALVMLGKSIDKRKKFFLSLKKSSSLVEHPRPYEREMPSWIKMLAEKKGYQISGQACRFLVDIIGNDIMSISNEIEKASIYAGDRKKIEIEDLEELSVDIKTRTVFQLIDAIGTKKLSKSLVNLKKLLDGGESPILILNIILRQIRMIWTGLDIIKRGGGENDVKKKVKLPPFAYRDYFKQLKLFGEAGMRDAYQRLYELDVKFKSTRIDKEKALELLVYKLCR